VSAVLYWVLCRNIDVDSEAALARAEADDLEREATAHLRPEAGAAPA